MPLFVRAGSIVPLGRVVQHSAEPVDSIELRVFGGRGGHFVFYDDEGDSCNYEHGAYEIIPMTWDDETKILTIADRIGTYATMPRTRMFVVYASGPADDLSSDRAQREVRHRIQYDGRHVTVRLGRQEGSKE